MQDLPDQCLFQLQSTVSLRSTNQWFWLISYPDANIVCSRARNHFDPDNRQDFSDSGTRSDLDSTIETFRCDFMPLAQVQSRRMYFMVRCLKSTFFFWSQLICILSKTVSTFWSPCYWYQLCISVIVCLFSFYQFPIVFYLWLLYASPMSYVTLDSYDMAILTAYPVCLFSNVTEYEYKH